MTRSDSDSLPQRTSEPLPVGVDLPPRVIVCQHGHYWRDYGDGLSMPPVSDDNLTCHAVATFALAAPPVPAGATLHDMDGHEECAYDNCEVTRLCPRTPEPPRCDGCGASVLSLRHFEGCPLAAPPVPAGDREGLAAALRRLRGSEDSIGRFNLDPSGDYVVRSVRAYEPAEPGA